MFWLLIWVVWFTLLFPFSRMQQPVMQSRLKKRLKRSLLQLKKLNLKKYSFVFLKNWPQHSWHLSCAIERNESIWKMRFFCLMIFLNLRFKENFTRCFRVRKKANKARSMGNLSFCLGGDVNMSVSLWVEF